MKIHKVTFTVIDFDEVGLDGVIETIENTHYPNRCIWPRFYSGESRDIGEWDDDHPLNQTDTAKAEIERLFGEEEPEIKKRILRLETALSDIEFFVDDPKIARIAEEALKEE